jgi:hypothetical protein
MGDIIELEQPLPLRWPIGDDCIRLIRERRMSPDEEWERRMRSNGWGFTDAEVER